jgi:hypothetical protein
MVLGVSTRRYARSLEPLPQEVAARSMSKSAVSERFVVGTQRRLAQLMQRDLSGLELVVLLIERCTWTTTWCWRRWASTNAARKHLLGLRQGATENAAACRALQADLVERGLNPNGAILVVIRRRHGGAQSGAGCLRQAGAHPPLLRLTRNAKLPMLFPSGCEARCATA